MNQPDFDSILQDVAKLEKKVTEQELETTDHCRYFVSISHLLNSVRTTLTELRDGAIPSDARLTELITKIDGNLLEINNRYQYILKQRQRKRDRDARWIKRLTSSS